MSGFLHQKDLYRVFIISENKENLNFDPLPPLWPFKAQKCNIYVHLNSIGICFILTPCHLSPCQTLHPSSCNNLILSYLDCPCSIIQIISASQTMLFKYCIIYFVELCDE